MGAGAVTADELRAALHAYMKRDDPETVGNEPVALELARQAVEKVFFPMEAEGLVPPLAVLNGRALLPPDFGKAIAVGRNFDYVAPRDWQRLQVNAPKHLAGCYSIYGGYVHVEPGITALSFVYYAQPQPIKGTETNWLADEYAPVWLHAARAEQYRFVEDVESATAADQLWRAMAREFEDESERRRQSGGRLRMRSR